MENPDINDLIERYLDGSLPPAERAALETRMAADDTFRAEVQLHRQLHEEFADPQKLQLRDMLGDILRQPPPPAKRPWLKGLGLAMSVLFMAGLAWYWFGPGKAAPVPDVKEEIKSIPPAVAPLDSSGIRSTPVEPPKNTPERPIAMADPAAFTPNREFEDRLGSVIRSTGGSANMLSPAMGSNFKPANGLVKIDFRGTAPAGADTAQYPLVLKIYDNRVAAGEPLFRVLPAINSRNAATGQWAFTSVQRLRLSPGLYYFTLELADEDLIFVGKFTVEAR